MIDARSCATLTERHRSDALFQAHVALSRMPGSGAWLIAPPVDGGREIDAPLFRISLERRLRAQICDDGFCPCCGDFISKYGEHALVCPCGGGHTVRHNAARNVCFEEASLAGTRPEREKASQLHKRPAADDLPQERSARRPADIWLPRGPSDHPEALDFAITSATRFQLIREASATLELVFARYEEHKRDHQQHTAQQCEQAGIRFIPMIMEAHSGSWSPLARNMLDWIARRSAAITLEEPATVSLRIAQRLSATLHRENSRAILKRLVASEQVTFMSAWNPRGGDES